LNRFWLTHCDNKLDGHNGERTRAILDFGGHIVRARSSEASLGGRGSNAAGNPLSYVVQSLLIAAISGGLFWLVWIYGSGLRDPRYLDGWVLAGGMAFQISFHIAKGFGLSLKSATRWRKIHILVGYMLIAAFISHSDFSLPDTGFEWVLGAGFVLLALSGIFGTYLAWALQAKHEIDGGISYDRIPALRAALERDVKAAVVEIDRLDKGSLRHPLTGFFPGAAQFHGPSRRLTTPA
jgi:hypothetical protein